MKCPFTSDCNGAYLTAAEVAAELACFEPTVRRRLRDGEPPAVSALPIEDLERITGRPRNSPGWGRLVAEKDKDLFRPADARDKATASIHRPNLQEAVRRLEAELREAPRRALCGAPMLGIPAPRGVAHLSRCAELRGGGQGRRRDKQDGS